VGVRAWARVGLGLERAVKSNGAEPKSSLITSCGEERKKPKG
jgi:hypothetical protein